MLIISISINTDVFSQDNVKKKLAVYMTGSDVDETTKKVIGAKLVGAITKSGEYAAVERTADFLAALEAENDYQTSGEVRDSQIARLGQKFGVRYVVVADMSDVFDELFIAARIINVESGLVERSFDVNGPAESMAQLVLLADKLSKGIIIQPELDKKARLKAIEDSITESKIKAQRERQYQQALQAQQERQDRERRRIQAIQNLMQKTGYKCYQLGNYIIMDDLISVNFSYDADKGYVKSSNIAPQGWLMADIDIFRAVMQAGRYGYVSGAFWVTCPKRAFPNRRQKFNEKKKLGSWTISCHTIDLYFRENKIIGETIKSGSDLPVFKNNYDSFLTLYYRPMFTDAEIEQEMSLIK